MQSLAQSFQEDALVYTQNIPTGFLQSGCRRTAATYSPTWCGSTIGDGELNFSVRNGKRWFLTAIATAVYDLRENSEQSRRTTQTRTSTSGVSFPEKDIGQLVQVS